MLYLPLRSSPRLAILLGLIYLGAILCLILSAAPIGLKLAGSTICLWSAWHNIRKYALLSSANAIVECTVLDEKNNLWQLKNYQAREQTVHLLGDSWRSRYMLILNFQVKEQRKRISVLLLNDMLPPELLRRLRVYLALSRT